MLAFKVSRLQMSFSRPIKGGQILSKKYIFPEGILPSEDKLNNAVSSAGLKILDDYYFGKSYAETLRRWQSTFEQKWDDVKTGFDEKFQRCGAITLATVKQGSKVVI